MEKKNKFIKSNIKVLIAFIIGFVLATTGVYAVSILSSSDVSYSNTTSKLTSTNVQGAIDELADKTQIRKRSNIVEAYTYNQTSGASNYCVTGEEDTCEKTECYKTKTQGSCPAGTIILYKVNTTTVVPFHVMFDEGDTMTMQSQRTTIYNTAWYTENDNTQGPLNILPILESATAGWTNVNFQTYTMGETVFKDNAFTGCDTYDSCTTNTYTSESRTARARMITMQESNALGCTSEDRSCPVWMYNYLYKSTSYGGTISDTNEVYEGISNYGYWTMSANSSSSTSAWLVHAYSMVVGDGVTRKNFGARAVVVVNK